MLSCRVMMAYLEVEGDNQSIQVFMGLCTDYVGIIWAYIGTGVPRV